MRRIGPNDLTNIDARRICIIKPSAFGDVVQTLPLLPVLRERFPDAELSWVINRPLVDLLAGHPHLDRIVPFDRRSSFTGRISFLRELRAGRFDLVFDLQGLLRSAVMTQATAARWRIGLETAREGANWAANAVLADTGRSVPAYLRYWRVAEALGLGDRKRQTLISVPREDRETVRQWMPHPATPRLAVHPGARWETKRWPIEYFAYVATRAVRVYGCEIFVVGGPDERDSGQELTQLIQKFSPAARVQNTCGTTTLKQLSVLLDEMDCVITNDSGPMHLAAGMGTPCVGVFTCTSAERSGPEGSRHELVSTNVSCAGSYCKRCPYRGAKRLACFQELEPERVWQALTRAIEKNRVIKHAA